MSSSSDVSRSDASRSDLSRSDGSPSSRRVRVRRRKKRREIRVHNWVHAAKVTAFWIFCLVVSASITYFLVRARETRLVLHSE